MEPSNRPPLDQAAARVRYLPLLMALAMAFPTVIKAANTDPVISAISAQTINVNATLGPLPFTIGDAETNANDLVLSAACSNTNLIALTNITFDGSGSNRTVSLVLRANQTGNATITVTVSDGDGGSDSEAFLVTVLSNVSFTPPPPANITDKDTSEVFDGININSDDPVAMKITFAQDRGSFALSSGFTKATVSGNAIYSLTSRSSANAQSFLRNLEFIPTENRLPVGQSEMTDFLVTATDANGPGHASVSLTVISTNDPPSVSFSNPAPAGITDKATSQPFEHFEISDPDTNDWVTVTLRFPNVRGSFPTNADFTKALAGSVAVYQLSSNTPAGAQAFLRALVYTPVENRIPIGETETTTFTVIAADASSAKGTNEVDLTVTPVNDAPRLHGLVLTVIGDNQNSRLFASLSVEDVDVARVAGVVTNQPVTLTVSNSIVVNGLSTLGGYQGQTNPFSLSDSATRVTSQLTNIAFVPVANLLPAGESNSFAVRFTLTDSVTNSPDNFATNVYIVSINDPPSISTTVNPSVIQDNQDGLPFSIALTDPDLNETDFTVQLGLIAGSSFGTLTPPGPFSGSIGNVETAVRAVRFTPARNVVTNSQVIQFRFSVTNHGNVAFATNQISVQEVNDLPDILGVASTAFRIRDDETVNPFPVVIIQDVDRSGAQLVSVAVSMDDSNKGTLVMTNSAGALGLSNVTPAQATIAIRDIRFIPKANRIPIDQTETVVLTITVTDILGGQRLNDRTSVIVTSVNGAPQISGISVTQPLPIPPGGPVKPFGEHVPYTAGVTIDDDDSNLVVTVSIDNPAKGILTNLGGFLNVGSGSYRITNTAAVVTMALTNLEFVVSDTFGFPPDSPGGTTFTISAVDSLPNTTTRTLAITLQDGAENHLVTRTEDDNQPGSLRHAIANAVNNAVITFALPTYPALIRLANGPIELTRHLAIKGPGADLLTISGDSDGNGSGDTQLFRVQAIVNMEGVTLTKGRGQAADSGGITGGAIYVGANGRLRMSYCAVTDSTASQWGGGIDVDQGSLAMDHCLVRGNSTDIALGLGGGGISLWTVQFCSFANTTFSANRQRAPTGIGGGAFYAENFDPGLELFASFNHCTFAENEDATDTGSSINANVFGTLITIQNSILADGRGRNLEVQGAALIVSAGGNLSDDSTRTTLTQGGQPQAIVLFDQLSDRTNSNIRLQPLNLNIRPTPAYPLQTNSPAIGLAVEFSEATDQRGVIRDGDPDSGAFELNAFQRMVINEIHFDPQTNEADFVELYVTRDSLPVDLLGYSLRVDGTNRYTFTTNTVIQPGRGVVFSDISIEAGESNNPTMVISNIAGGQLRLERRSEVEVRRADGKPVATMSYLGQYVDPEDATNKTKYAHNSITLAPQFMGFALLPHRTVLPPPRGGALVNRAGSTTSPGRDTGNRAFGAPNALPLVTQDLVLLGEDDLSILDVLGNDLDADGLDRLVIVDVSMSLAQGGDDATEFSANGASVVINPSSSPLRGTAIIYDPRSTTNLQRLAEGARRTDTFTYTIVDIGGGPISAYQSLSNNALTKVVSPAHRLTNGEPIVISGSGTSNYNGEYSGTNLIVRLDDDSFSIPVGFVDNPAGKGSWSTVGSRQPTQRSETNVVVTVLGANDPPTPNGDIVSTDEETVLRIMADPNLAGSSNAVFDTDGLYPLPRQISAVNLLSNDTDPDTDDNATTLKVVGVVKEVHPITSFAGTPGVSPVVITSTNHGLANGTMILISGYAGHPSYNGYHVVTLVNSNSFSIATTFVDHNPLHSAVWAILNDANRLDASSALGATVKLEIRADRTRSCVVYNPRASAYLNGTALGETNLDSFYYAVEDSHAAVTLALVTVRVAGVNDVPVPVTDPSSVTALGSLVNPSNSLGQIIAQLKPLYYLPPASGLSNRTDAQVQFSNATTLASLLLRDLWTTDEDTALLVLSTNLLGNDSDVDRSDVLTVKSVAGFSREGAALTLSSNGLSITYNPATSTNLNKLAREELRVDAFSIVITDSRGADVTNLVSVLVLGQNDTPVARPDSDSTYEDVLLTLDPILHPTNNPALHDSDADINGVSPDNQLSLVPVTNHLTPGGALVSIVGNQIIYNPTNSAFLNSLAHTQMFVDTFVYTLMDGSFIFANDDLFKVDADGSGFTLNVMANDRNFTGQGGALSIIAVGSPDQHGTAVLQGGTNIVYTPQINFVGDEVFTYTISDEDGNTDSALVRVRVTIAQLNGNLQANDDRFTAAKGQSSTLDVLANDNVLPANGATLTIINHSPLSAGGQVSIVANKFIYTPDPAAANFPYHEVFTYEISGGGTARATAQVDMLVVNRENTLNIRNDWFSVQAGSLNNSLDVLLNDNVLPGSTVGLRIVDLQTNADFHGDISINAAGSALIYRPDTGFVGLETLSYVVSDDLGGTGTGTITISVGGLGACNDFFVVPFNTNPPPVELNVLANDFALQTAAGTNITIVSVVAVTSNTPIGAIAINASGTRLLFGPAISESEQEFAYTITDGFGRSAVGRVTVVVVSEGVKANADFFTVGVDSLANEVNVLANDAAIPNLGRPLTVISIGSGVDAPNHGGTVQISAGNDRLIYTPAPGFSGEESFTYTMTDTRDTDTARVVMKVSAGELSANADTFTVFFEVPSDEVDPMSFTLPVLANDRALPDLGQQLTITIVGPDAPATNAPAQAGSLAISADSKALIYTPRDTNGPFPYVERFAYEISDGTTRRAAAVVTVEVQKRTDVHELETNDDAYSVRSSSANNVLRVLANDGIKPATAAAWTITSLTATLFNGVVTISGTTILYMPQPGFVGTDRFTYVVSDGLGGTGQAEVRVKVGDLPICDDVFTVISGSSNNVMDVLANDAIRHGTATNFLLFDAQGNGPSNRFVVASGVVLYSPDPASTNFPYTEVFLYRVQDHSLGTVTGRVSVTVYQAGSDRNSALLSVTVNGVNDVPTIGGTAPAGTITDKQTLQPFTAATIGEVDAQALQPLTVTVSLPPGRGFLTNLSAFNQMASNVYTFIGTAAAATTALRGLIYDPIENRITVPTSETTTFILSAHDGVASQPTLDTNTTVTVIAINDPPVISGTVSNQTVYQYLTVKPFAGFTVTEIDDLTLQPLRITVTLDNATHGFLSSLGGFVDQGGGVYLLGTTNAGVTAAAASATLRALVFVPTTGNRVIPIAPESTRFTIQVDDSFAEPVIDSNTTVLAIHEFNTKVLASDGITGDSLGFSVAALHDVVVAGAPGADPHGNGSGAAYIYLHSSLILTQWTQFQKLDAADGAAGDEFGSAVGATGNTIAVGARSKVSGCVYVFQRTIGGSNTWAQVKKITPAGGANGDLFGSSLFMNGDTLVVGAPGADDIGSSSGAAFVYSRNVGGSNNWGLVKKLIASDAAAGDQFGLSVGLDGDTVIVGAPLDVVGGISSGSAYLFGRNQGGTTNWGQIKKVVASDGLGTDEFGHSVSIYGETLVVGASRHDHPGNDSGAAYIFERHQGGANQWGQLKELLSPTALNNDQFGYSVSINRDKLVVGAPFSGFDNQSKYGSAWAYARNVDSNNSWGLLQKLERPDAVNNDQFGLAVAVGQDTVAVGANGTDARGNDSGSTYIYRLKYNNAPQLVIPIPDQAGSTNVPFALALPGNTFADPDVDDLLTLSASLSDSSPLPAWLSFTGPSATFNGTPAAPGIYVIRVTAADEDSATVSATFNLSILGSSNRIGEFMPIYLTIMDAPQSGKVVLSYTRPLNANGADYLLQVSSNLFAWNPSSALINISPVDASTEIVTLQVDKSGAIPQFFRIQKTGN